MDTLIQQLLSIGGLIVGAFSAGYAVGQALSRRTISILRAEYQRLDRLFGEEKDKSVNLGLQVTGLKSENELLRKQGESEAVAELRRRIEKYDRFRTALMGTEDELWRLGPSEAPPGARMTGSQIRVITVANLKGGVGKTTLVANLMAYFAIRHGKRVLAIDFDYQGSLTRMVTLGANLPGSSILADTMLNGTSDGTWVCTSARELAAILPGSRLVTSGQTFDRFENRTQMQWLLGETPDDVRFRLARILLHPDVARDFDVVLIDAPPRLSMGAINAICASHSLIVPTVRPSARLTVAAVGAIQSSPTVKLLSLELARCGAATA
jgi:MinD-like ATPase involved in chromosome partitioning or flagellar assembly